MKNRLIVPGLIALVALTASISVAASGSSLEGIKCLLVSKKDANKDKAAKWKEGKVYFCCDGCLGKYEKMSKEDKTKHAAAANHQLVATKQYEQKGCPFSGGDIKKGSEIKVNGASIGFCCDNCKAKAEKMKDKDKISKLFGEEAFKKAKFTVVKKKK